MLSAQQLIMIFVGIIICFTGYSIFRSMLPLWGFLLGGWIGYTLILPMVPMVQNGSPLLQGIAFLLAGAIGAGIARPLYYVTVFLSGAVLGGVVGVFLGAIFEVGGIGSIRQIQTLIDMAFPPIPQTGTQFLLVIVLGILAGGLAIMFQRFMLIASTSFIGSALLVSGMGPLLQQWIDNGAGRAVVIVVGWLLVGFASMFIQSQLTPE
jgi:hypothetical protein